MASAPEAPAQDWRVDVFIAGLAVALSVGGFARVVFDQRAFLAEQPQDLLWVVLALVAGGTTFFANGFVPLSGRTLLWAGYGTFAMLAGFSMQGVVNGGIVRTTPPDAHGLGYFLALGAGAGFCQTLGKWLMIRLLNRIHRPTARLDVLAGGLAVGLGFGLSEVLFIGTQLIHAGTVIQGIGAIGIWERCAAVGFHVFSGGLLAIGLASGATWPLLVVLLVHTLEDFLAGALGGGVVLLPSIAVEALYSLMTVALVLVFRRAARDVPA
jgi:hypothetical protein